MSTSLSNEYCIFLDALKSLLNSSGTMESILRAIYPLCKELAVQTVTVDLQNWIKEGVQRGEVSYKYDPKLRLDIIKYEKSDQ